MTVQEVKESIEYLKMQLTEDLEMICFTGDELKALDISIQALEEVEQYRALGTVEELKEAKKLLEKLEELKFANEERGYDTAKDVIQEIINLVDEQPKTDWIPCEVELPKTNGVYQVIREIKEGEVTYHIPTASYFDGQNTWHNDICVNFGRQNEQNVIAWQPIQPYKKEGAENE